MDDASSESQDEENEDEEGTEDEDEDVDVDENQRKKVKLVAVDELIKDELFENAANQKLSSEKNSINRFHVAFNQLSIVDEEDELKKENKFSHEDKQSVPQQQSEITSNKEKDEYLSGNALGWIITPECPAIPLSKKQVLFGNSTPGISTIIKSEGGQAQTPTPPSPLLIGWEREDFQGDAGHASTTMDRQTCAESIVRASTRLPRDITGLSTFALSDNKSTEVSINTIAPLLSSEIVQKTSPDICVTGAVASQINFGSSDQLLTNNTRDSLSKSFSCQELAKAQSFSSNMSRGLEAKSLPDYSTPRAFRSQLKVQLNKLPPDATPQMPPKMTPIDWTPRALFHDTPKLIDRHEHKLPLDQYQATSFESPTPRSLTLPSTIPFSAYSKLLARPERKIVQVCPNVVNTQTQTFERSDQSASRSRSSSTSSAEQAIKKETKSTKLKKIKQQKNSTNKPTVSIRSSNDTKTRRDDQKSERQSSSSGHECHKKPPKTSRYSQGAKRRASSRSQSIAQSPEISEITVKERIVSAERTRKSSITSDRVPWCACWGNGCV